MTDDEHHRALERMYAAAPINRFYAPHIEVERGSARLTLPAREEYWHAAGAVHGSVLFKALDDAAYFAAASLVRRVFLLTASFHVHFLRPVVAGDMTASGEVIERSRRLIVAESWLSDARGRRLARGSGTFLPGEIELSPELGYAG